MENPDQKRSGDPQEIAPTNDNPYILTYGHFVLLVIIAIYFQLSVARSFFFDIVFSGIVLFFCYNLYEAFVHGRNIVVDINYNRSYSPIQKSHVYSLEEIKSLKTNVPPDFKFFTNRIEVIPSIHLSCSSPTRSSTPDYKGRLKELTNSIPPFSSQDSFEISPIHKEEQKAYSYMMREMSHETENFDLIPKDPQIGKIEWINQSYGRIKTIDPVLKLNLFYFENRYCVVDDDEPPLKEGDRVMFTIMISENKLFATNVRRVAKRTISSPDFSRLVMRQNVLLPLDDFEL